MLIREAGRRAELQPRDGHDEKFIGGEPSEHRQRIGSVSGFDMPARSLIESAEENSVTTQSLIASSSSACWPSQRCIRSVSVSLVNAATSSEVSR